jgi:DNA-binding GntR family transcriptional regulator
VALGQNIPLFFRLYHKLKQDIVRGEIQKGAKIGTIEELAQQHGMSQTSVRKSLDLLEMEGLLLRKQGWGTVVPENLDLHFFDLATLISSRETIPEVKNADFYFISSGWVEPNARLKSLTGVTDTASPQPVYRIYCRVMFTGKLKFKALITFCFPKEWIRKANIKKSTPPRDIIIRLTEWLESGTLTMKETLLPFLCTDEAAEQLGIPDGTPVFFHTVVLTDAKHNTCLCWDMISTANVFFREMKLD